MLPFVGKLAPSNLFYSDISEFFHWLFPSLLEVKQIHHLCRLALYRSVLYNISTFAFNFCFEAVGGQWRLNLSCFQTWAVERLTFLCSRPTGAVRARPWCGANQCSPDTCKVTGYVWPQSRVRQQVGGIFRCTISVNVIILLCFGSILCCVVHMCHMCTAL